MFGFARGAAEEAEKETGVKLKSSSPIPKALLASFQQALKEQVLDCCQLLSITCSLISIDLNFRQLMNWRTLDGWQTLQPSIEYCAFV